MPTGADDRAIRDHGRRAVRHTVAGVDAVAGVECSAAIVHRRACGRRAAAQSLRVVRAGLIVAGVAAEQSRDRTGSRLPFGVVAGRVAAVAIVEHVLRLIVGVVRVVAAGVAAERQHRHAAAEADQSRRDADGVAGHVTFGDRVNIDVLPRGDARAVADPSRRVVAHDLHIHAAADSHSAAGNRRADRQDRHVVRRADADRLLSARRVVVRRLIDACAVANFGGRVRVEDLDADRTGDSREQSRRAAAGDVEHVLRRDRLHRDAANRLAQRVAAAVLLAGEHRHRGRRIRFRIDDRVRADERARPLFDQRHADRTADSRRADAQADAPRDDVGVGQIGRLHQHVAASIDDRATADERRRRVVDRDARSRAADSDFAAHRQSRRDRQNVFRCERRDDDVRLRGDFRACADARFGRVRDQRGFDAGRDPGRSRDRPRTADAQVREVVPRRDVNALRTARASIRQRPLCLIHVHVVGEERARVRRHQRDAPRKLHRRRATRSDADCRCLHAVSIDRRHRDAGEVGSHVRRRRAPRRQRIVLRFRTAGAVALHRDFVLAAGQRRRADREVTGLDGQPATQTERVDVRIRTEKRFGPFIDDRDSGRSPHRRAAASRDHSGNDVEVRDIIRRDRHAARREHSLGRVHSGRRRIVADKRLRGEIHDIHRRAARQSRRTSRADRS